MAETWDETKPAGTRNPKLGDDDIREHKRAIRERMAEEHHMEAIETTAYGSAGSQIGRHKKITLIEQAANPVTLADELALIAKDVTGHPELFLVPELGGAAIQLTTGNVTLINKAVVELLKDITASAAEINQLAGYSLFPAGTVMLFGNNAAPVGWTRKSDWQDNAMLCFAGAGDIAGGGAVNPQTAHAHTGPSHMHTGPSHTHTGPSHRHTGPSHSHGVGTYKFRTLTGYLNRLRGYDSVGGTKTITSTAAISIGAGEVALTLYNAAALNDDIFYTANGIGTSAASGTGLTGAGGTGSTGVSGTGNTGASGTGATSANTAPHYQEVIAATKD
ncbi:MAG: hypothetical protein HKM93_08905 [Desulfobacteraceae bacterium]|nr:hypothetical protein [Desulfobacteraceae bacterium]